MLGTCVYININKHIYANLEYYKKFLTEDYMISWHVEHILLIAVY